MTFLGQLLASTLVALVVLAVFGGTIYAATRNGKSFGCTAIGKENELCDNCPGRGIRCTIKRTLKKRQVEA